MAIPAAAVWEIRPANGTLNAGGGFHAAGSSPGTDWSQQDAVQVAFDGVTITASIAAAGATILIAGYTVLATDNRNFLAITTTGSGTFLVNIYEIIAVDTVGNTWTLDQNVASAAATAMVGNMGGARRGYNANGGVSPATSLQSKLVAGNTVHVKNETWDEAVACTIAGTSAAPIKHYGYNATRGDNPTGTDRPLNDRNSVGADAISSTGADNWWHYMRATRAADAGFSLSGVGTRGVHLHSYNNTGEGFEHPAGDFLRYVACESNGNGSQGFGPNLTGHAHGCYAHDNASQGFQSNGFGVQLSFCIAAYNANHGVGAPGSTSTILNLTSVNNVGTAVDGLNSDAVRGTLGNSILAYNGRDGARANDGDSWGVFNNNYYLNTGTARTNMPAGVGDLALDPGFAAGSQTFIDTDVDAGANSINLTGNALVVNELVSFTTSASDLPAPLAVNTPYYVITAATAIVVSATRGGAAVNITDGGSGTHTIHYNRDNYAVGANMKAVGFPGVINGAGTGYLDGGAVQRQEVASGGSGSQRVIGG